MFALALLLAIDGSCTQRPELPPENATAPRRPAETKRRNAPDDRPHPPSPSVEGEKPHRRSAFLLLLLIGAGLLFLGYRALKRRAYSEPYDIAPLLESEEIY
jgi:hypothetical protein